MMALFLIWRLWYLLAIHKYKSKSALLMYINDVCTFLEGDMGLVGHL